MSDLSASLAELSPDVRAIVEAARKTIRSIRRDAEETSCGMNMPRSRSMMWKLARYSVRDEVVVTIGAFTNHGSIFFQRGSELSDPTGVLQGTGKSLRYITLRTPKDVATAAVRAIIREAFELELRPSGGRTTSAPHPKKNVSRAPRK